MGSKKKITCHLQNRRVWQVTISHFDSTQISTRWNQSDYQAVPYLVLATTTITFATVDMIDTSHVVLSIAMQ